MDIGDSLTVLGLFLAVWLALVAYYRADVGQLIQRVQNTMADLENDVEHFWVSTRNPDENARRCASVRLTTKCDRLAYQLEMTKRRLHIKTRFGICELIDAATMDIESSAESAPAERAERFFRVHANNSRIAATLESQYDHWGRKLFWW